MKTYIHEGYLAMREDRVWLHDGPRSILQNSTYREKTGSAVRSHARLCCTRSFERALSPVGTKWDNGLMVNLAGSLLGFLVSRSTFLFRTTVTISLDPMEQVVPLTGFILWWNLPWRASSAVQREMPQNQRSAQIDKAVRDGSQDRGVNGSSGPENEHQQFVGW